MDWLGARQVRSTNSVCPDSWAKPQGRDRLQLEALSQPKVSGLTGAIHMPGATLIKWLSC